MTVPTFPAAAAAALFLERQHLERPRALRFSPATVARLLEDTGGLQIDSINVVERGHLLTLWSRFGPYERARFERLAYRDKAVLEYLAHVACFVPIAHLPAWRRAMLDLRQHSFTATWLRKNRRIEREVMDAIRTRGPMASSDFAHTRPPGAGGWWSWKPATHGLVRLWIAGFLAVVGRERFEKRYDLWERYAPEWLEVEPLPSDQFDRWHVRQSLHAMGAATETDLRMYLTWPRIKVTRRRPVLAAMLREGEIVEVAIDGAGRRTRWLALAEDVPALARASRRRTPTGSTLLSPFDSFLWHRERTKRLFGFDYRLEVYTPGHQRTHGYYTLPMLHDGQLVGRVDAKLHRDHGVLEARRVQIEPWVGGRQPPPVWGAPLALEAVLAGVAESLASLASFTDASRVKLGRTAPARLGAPLRRALRAAVPAQA